MTRAIAGTVFEACSCKMFYPCVVGPADPTFGWCAVAILYDIRSGDADGVKLEGCKVVWTADFPGYFGDGHGVSRLYIDETADPLQREKLEVLWKGQRGGPPAIVDALTTKWLFTRFTDISMQEGEKPSFTVGDVGKVVLDPVKNDKGELMRVEHGPAWGPQGLQNDAIAYAHGSYMFDPEMRRWVSGGFGAMQTFRWSGE